MIVQFESCIHHFFLAVTSKQPGSLVGIYDQWLLDFVVLPVVQHAGGRGKLPVKTCMDVGHL